MFDDPMGRKETNFVLAHPANLKNILLTPDEVDVANWLQQVKAIMY